MNKVVTKKESLSGLIGFTGTIELEFEDQLKILTDLRENLIRLLNWPDGEVAVELTIKRGVVNV